MKLPLLIEVLNGEEEGEMPNHFSKRDMFSDMVMSEWLKVKVRVNVDERDQVW